MVDPNINALVHQLLEEECVDLDVVSLVKRIQSSQHRFQERPKIRLWLLGDFWYSLILSGNQHLLAESFQKTL